MALSIEIFENRISRGTYDFEAAPRIGEKLEIAGKHGTWLVLDVRHLTVRNAPAQLQIAIERAPRE